MNGTSGWGVDYQRQVPMFLPHWGAWRRLFQALGWSTRGTGGAKR